MKRPDSFDVFNWALTSMFVSSAILFAAFVVWAIKCMFWGYP